MAGQQLFNSSFKHTINALIGRIDIAQWLFNHPDADYQRCCPPGNFAAGTTSTDDGQRMSINVEQIGETLAIQHYVGEVTEKHYCHIVLQSGIYSPNGRSKAQAIWDLSAKTIDGGHCGYTNSVIAVTTPEFLTLVKSTVSSWSSPQPLANRPRETTIGGRSRSSLKGLSAALSPSRLLMTAKNLRCWTSEMRHGSSQYSQLAKARKITPSNGVAD